MAPRGQSARPRSRCAASAYAPRAPARRAPCRRVENEPERSRAPTRPSLARVKTAQYSRADEGIAPRDRRNWYVAGFGALALMLPLALGQAADRPLHILCLGAHSDDIEIGCG